MYSTLATTRVSSFSFPSSRLQFRKPNLDVRFSSLKLAFAPIRASGGKFDRDDGRGWIVDKIKKTAGVVVLAAVTNSMIGRFGQLPAMAETPMTTVSEESPVEDQSAEVVVEEKGELKSSVAGDVTPLAELLQENSEAVEVLKALLEQKMENGEDELALKILKIGEGSARSG